jgi:hypothetical protein
MMKVDLCWYTVANRGIIIEDESSPVTWTNQVGGTSCEHPEIRGIFIPLPNLGTLPQTLRGHWPDMPEHLADHLDTDMKGRQMPCTVDRERWAQSCEAWLYVIVQPIERDEYLPHPLCDFNGRRGVLTWMNSD